MLPEPPKPRINATEPTFVSVHNYFEPLVFRHLLEVSAKAREDGEFAADTACVALNQLPARYIRHDVDQAFFLSADQVESMERQVRFAVENALAFVESRADKRPRSR